jgi:hypothetical protein
LIIPTTLTKEYIYIRNQYIRINDIKLYLQLYIRPKESVYITFGIGLHQVHNMGGQQSNLYPDGGKPITMDRIRGACRVNTKITPEAQRFLVEALVRDLNLYSGANIQLRTGNGSLRGLGDVCDEVYELVPNADKVCKLNNSGTANIEEIVKLAMKFNKAYGSSIQVYRDPLDPKSGKLPADVICGQLFQVQDYVRRSLRSDFDAMKEEMETRLDELRQLRATILAEDAAYGVGTVIDLKEDEEAERIRRLLAAGKGIRKAADTLMYDVTLKTQNIVNEINDGIIRDEELAALLNKSGALNSDSGTRVQIAVTGGGHQTGGAGEVVSIQASNGNAYDASKAARLVHTAVLANAGKVDQAFRHLPVALTGEKAELREKVLKEIDSLKSYPELYRDFEPIAKALRRDTTVMKEAENFAGRADALAQLLNK